MHFKKFLFDLMEGSRAAPLTNCRRPQPTTRHAEDDRVRGGLCIWRVLTEADERSIQRFFLASRWKGVDCLRNVLEPFVPREGREIERANCQQLWRYVPARYVESAACVRPIRLTVDV